MPWLDNDWIRHCNPIKLKEYLALGQEVVTTWFPEAQHYLDFLHIGRTGDEFLQRLDEVVAGNKSVGDRDALLAGASWDDRTNELIGYLDSLAQRLAVANG